MYRFCKNSGQDRTVKIIFRTENLGLGEAFFELLLFLVICNMF